MWHGLWRDGPPATPPASAAPPATAAAASPAATAPSAPTAPPTIATASFPVAVAVGVSAATTVQVALALALGLAGEEEEAPAPPPDASRQARAALVAPRRRRWRGGGRAGFVRGRHHRLPGPRGRAGPDPGGPGQQRQEDRGRDAGGARPRGGRARQAALRPVQRAGWLDRVRARALPALQRRGVLQPGGAGLQGDAGADPGRAIRTREQALHAAPADPARRLGVPQRALRQPLLREAPVLPPLRR
mmetsp:Transcript_83876/g.245903  ORF Transcript_83876/g.245903 Transcript_83876/m.245903 type:complete len:246 (+) Transcript_83876:1184-1921(+)